MTEQEAKIALLEDALFQAQWTVEFLHNCLTNPKNYSYAHPEQILKHLKDWAELAPTPKLCHHSYSNKECESCKERDVRREKLFNAKKQIS